MDLFTIMASAPNITQIIKDMFSEDFIEMLIGKSIRIIIIGLLIFIAIKLGNKIINKFVQRQIKSKLSFSMDPQKAITIGEVLKSVLKYVVYIIGVGTICGEVFTNIPSGLVAAGGFAIGIGAQSLVKDFINGFFILFEDQFGVGDHVTIGQFTGIVETIGIRNTGIRAFTGDLHLISNGNIIEVTNHSRGNISFIVDVDIAYEEDIDNAVKVIEKAIGKFEEANKEDIAEPVQVLGVIALAASGVTIRVLGKAKPLKQWALERELRKDIKVALDNAKIEIPYPKTQIIK